MAFIGVLFRITIFGGYHIRKKSSTEIANYVLQYLCVIISNNNDVVNLQ